MVIIPQVDLSAFDRNLLILLEALFEARSVTQAENRLDLSQPAASRALGRPQRMPGDPLVVRGTGWHDRHHADPRHARPRRTLLSIVEEESARAVAGAPRRR